MIATYPRDLAQVAVAVVVVFAAVMFFGIVIRTVIGSALLRWVDGLFKNVPGLSTIYFSTKQVVDIVRPGKKQFFTHPVMVEYPSSDIWAIGFNTGELKSNGFSNADMKKRYTVFIPTTPNPTSGFLAVLPEDKIYKLDVSAEDAVKMILTGGIIKTPTDRSTSISEYGYRESKPD